MDKLESMLGSYMWELGRRNGEKYVAANLFGEQHAIGYETEFELEDAKRRILRSMVYEIGKACPIEMDYFDEEERRIKTLTIEADYG